MGYALRSGDWSCDVCPSDPPVWGRRVDPATAKHRAKHDGGEYYFCSAKCRERFEARPEIFLGDAPAVAPQGSKDLISTCPIHPEVEQVGPGRAAERRVGKGCVSPCRYRWSPDH